MSGSLTAGARAPFAAMVFAAGLGTRMRPVTNTLPKPMVKIAGRPLMDHALDRLAQAGVEKAVVNVHWLPDLIIDHLRGRTSPKIVISDEREKLLDQGGGIIPASWVAATRNADPSVFGAPYTEVLPEGAYRNQWWVENPQSRTLYARGVFGQMMCVNWNHRMVAVKLSSWPDFQNPNLTRATMRALHAIAEHLS